MKNLKKVWKEKFKIIFLGLSICFIGGCSNVETWSENLMEKEVIAKSELLSEGEIEYQKVEEESKNEEFVGLFSNGIWTRPSEEKVEQKQEENDGKVHVTFANNSRLDICYYSDVQMQNKINVDDCYLEPNACIYAFISKETGAMANKYKFENFRIYQYDAQGNGTLLKTVALEENNFVYCIPEMNEECGISIVPIGVYEDRTISLNTYVIGKSGGKTEEISGYWLVNNEKYNNGTVSLSPLSSYVVSYKYDSDVFYFVSSSPVCLYPKEKGNTDGYVNFEVQESENPEENFSVELHRFLTATIDNSAKGVRAVYVGEKSIGEDKIKKNNVVVDKLQSGQKVKIVTDIAHKLTSSNVNLDKPEKNSDNEYVYTFFVPDVSEMQMNFSVKKWNTKKVTVTTDKSSGWTFPWNKPESTILEIFSGGTTYSYETLQKNGTVDLSENDDLTIDVHTELLKDKQQVLITSKGKEILKVDKNSEESKKTLKYSEVETLDIKIVTVEDANFKGKLTVVLDKSLEEDNSDILFNIGASGGTIVSNAHYTKGSEKICDEQHVNVEQDIVVSSESVSVLANKAIKIEIEKDGKLVEIYYTSEKEFKKIISTWNGSKRSSDIKISISLVEVEEHKGSFGENYSVEVQFANADKKIIAEGDIVEGSRTVIVRIIPSDGYYIDFAKKTYNENGVYQRSMKYSDYQKKIKDIINDNPVKKMITITLDESVPYQCGTVSYKVDGEDYEAGTYLFKEETKISMILKINADSDYGILNGEFFSFINKYKEEDTEKIIITKDMDNTILSVKDYMTIE